MSTKPQIIKTTTVMLKLAGIFLFPFGGEGRVIFSYSFRDHTQTLTTVLSHCLSILKQPRVELYLMGIYTYMSMLIKTLVYVILE